MNTHGNVVFNSEAYRRWMDAHAGRRACSAIAPLFHITGLVAHLTVGLLVPMPIVLGFRFDPANMLDLIERWRPTFTVGAITAFIALMNDPSWDGRDLSSLTKVYSGGAPIAPATVERFQREAGAYIHNIYGLTETTSPSHGVPMGAPAPVDPNSGALSVGVPIFNTVVRVVDEEGNEVAARRDRRVRHERAAGRRRLLEQAGGDRARPARAATCTPATSASWTSEGWFYVVDRKKDMIIAVGYKVWPREVENVLYQHPAVREAAVVGVPDEYRGETVKAFVSLRPGEAADRGRADRVLQGADVGVQVPTLDRVRRRAAEDGDRQDPPPRAACRTVRLHVSRTLRPSGPDHARPSDRDPDRDVVAAR